VAIAVSVATVVIVAASEKKAEAVTLEDLVMEEAPADLVLQVAIAVLVVALVMAVTVVLVMALLVKVAILELLVKKVLQELHAKKVLQEEKALAVRKELLALPISVNATTQEVLRKINRQNPEKRSSLNGKIILLKAVRNGQPLFFPVIPFFRPLHALIL
jgi:hypothetical protein